MQVGRPVWGLLQEFRSKTMVAGRGGGETWSECGQRNRCSERLDVGREGKIGVKDHSKVSGLRMLAKEGGLWVWQDGIGVCKQ